MRIIRSVSMNAPDEHLDGTPWAERPVRIALPAWVMAIVPSAAGVGSGAVRRSAHVIHTVLPVCMMAVGLPVAVFAAVIDERYGHDAFGAFGVEVGGLTWCAGAVLLGARPAPTVRRAIMLVLASLGGLALIATAFLVEMSDIWLGLMMEFGVGAIGVTLIDTLILGVLYGRLDAIAHPPDDQTVTVRFRKSVRFLEITPADPSDASAR